MGRVRGSDIKDVVRDLVDTFPEKFTDNFEENKKALAEFDIFQSKRHRNRVAGYLTTEVIKRRKRPQI